MPTTCETIESIHLLIHGRRATYQAAHCRCEPCTAANAAYIAQLRRLRIYGRQPLGICVPAGETARRVQQLLIERVTKGQIARALGYRWPRLRVHTKPGEWVTLRTALRIKRLHRLWLGDGVDHPAR